ncbi:MAG: bifunctional DNA primase/polymerase, partial [Bryobacteraceae bacterium]|nr:bifunctional DNA primase/polymerase [Bryobacteraceae bacterium]
MTGPDDLRLAEAALWYASRGIPVFPCCPREKKPLVEGGFHAATTDEQRVRAWWDRWPDANIGIPTGAPSGWLVVDVDPRNGGNETMNDWITRYGRWPDTAEAITGGGGRHIVFRHVDGLRCGPLGDGVDLKADGGYVVVAPSIHPSGGRYTWDGISGAEALARLVEPPGWLLRLARERRKTESAAAGGTKIPAGRRNVELTSIAGVLRARGAGEAELRELLGAINAKLCDPPLEDEEVGRIAHSVARYDPAANAQQPDSQRIFELVEEGRYRLTMPGICAQLEADFVRRESGALVCELTVRCNLPDSRGVDGVVSVAEFNISSARARQERAKLIAARVGAKDAIDWMGIIEEFSQRILAAERDGGGATDLTDIPLEDEDTSAWWIDGIPIYKRHHNCLYGRGGALKSLLALYFASELARRGHQVLYADFEFEAAVHRQRLAKLAGDIRGIQYVRCTRPLIDECERLRRIAQAHGCALVIVDSIVLACHGPAESAEVAGRFFQALRRIGTGTLLIGHTSKADPLEGLPTIFGSGFWEYSLRNAWFVKRDDQTSSGHTVEICLFQKKTNLGPKLSPRGFRIEFGPDRITVRAIDVPTTPDFSRHMTLAQKVELALRRGPLPLEALAEEVSSTPSSIRSLISRRGGTFTRLPDGRVALLARV